MTSTAAYDNDRCALVAVRNTATPAAARVEWVDALRGLAALAVVLFHARVPLWVGWRAVMADENASALDRAIAWLALPFPFFGTTVMLFFVVSGFAIHYPYAHAGVSFAPGPYAIRRWFRIYPPYVAAVALTMAAEWTTAALLGSEPSAPAKTGATLAMVQNYVPPAGQMTGNPSLWSLPVEVELYLAYPLLLWIWRRVGTGPLLAMVGAVSIGAAGALLVGHQWPMGNFAKYWILWVAGAVLAELTRNGAMPQWRAWYPALLAAALALAAVVRVAAVPFGIEHFLWGGIYTLVLLWGLNHPAPLAWMAPRLKAAMLFLGEISYSLYLVHFPVLLALGAIWLAAFGEKPSNLLVALAACVVPIAVAAATWRLVERPSQAWGRALARASARRPTAGAIVAGAVGQSR